LLAVLVEELALSEEAVYQKEVAHQFDFIM
jgi:hypothetical protein